MRKLLKVCEITADGTEKDELILFLPPNMCLKTLIASDEQGQVILDCDLSIPINTGNGNPDFAGAKVPENCTAHITAFWEEK